MNTTYSIPVMDKLVIYQIFTRLFGNQNTTNIPWGSREQNGVGSFSDINNAALQSLKTFGISHIWYTGVLEHATQTDYSDQGIRPDDPAIVKGRAGSPYAVKDYYDVDPDLAVNVSNRMAEFEALLQRTHACGLKVIIDFVPNHVARQYQSDTLPEGVTDLGATDDTRVDFSPQNNFYYLPGKTFIAPSADSSDRPEGGWPEFPAKITGSGSLTEAPDINDWYETVKLNYGLDIFTNYQPHFDPVPDTWQKMLHILLFWAAKGVDGFRCDMAHFVPVEFWGWATTRVKRAYPGTIFIAEIYDPGLYRRFITKGGFDYLYDKVGLYDALRRLIEGHGSCRDITHVWQHESGDFSENMLRFLETHDEQRIASSFFATNPWLAIPAMTVTATLHAGPYLLYFGQEIGVRAEESEGFSGDDGRTTIFDYWGLPDWQGYLAGGQFDSSGLTVEQHKLRQCYHRLNHLVNHSDAVRQGGFYDLQYANEENWSYNPERIYCYLRYSERQKLLIVCNFDHEVTYDTSIWIPEHAWQTIGLNPENTYRFNDIFLTQRLFEANGSAPLAITLAPVSVLVLEIQSV